MTHRLFTLQLMTAFAVIAVGCDAEVAPTGPAPQRAAVDLQGLPQTAQALDARCTADVEGVGAVDVEADYLPHVVACENGTASLEALKAQAVAARSYLYYKAAAYPGQPITDGQGDQVYTCNNAPQPIHYEAVAATAGEVLTFQGDYVAAFYVAGSVPTGEACQGLEDDNDYSQTQHYVTYNWGRRAAGLEQTTLGWVHEDNHANRGCKSQNGADCLSDTGWDYEDILRYFYGMDIELNVAAGECVARVPSAHGCSDAIADETVIIDDTDGCFFVGCASEDALFEVSGGEGGTALMTGTTDAADCVARWQLSFDATGEKRVKIHLPEELSEGLELSYRVRHAGMDSWITVSDADAGWVDLGVFFFEEGRHQFIELADEVGVNADVDGPYVTFDAVAVGLPDGTFPSLPADGGTVDAGEDAGSDDPEADAGVGPGQGSGAQGEPPAPEADDPEPLPPSVQECSCAAVPMRSPAGPLFAVFFTLFFARAAGRRMPTSRWRR